MMLNGFSLFRLTHRSPLAGELNSVQKSVILHA